MPELTFTQTRACLDLISEIAGEHAGLPMPIKDQRLVIHPNYPWAETFNKLEPRSEESEDKDHEFINSWYSSRHGREFIMMRYKGRITHGLLPVVNHASMQLNTLGIAPAWDIGAEAMAQKKLAELLKHHTFRSYLLTGSFLETSKRSKITYLFRRLRPTIAMSTSDGYMKILCALCLHPIGYYEGTWAGCMVPTDEVVAHLMLMRGDEHGFWKQANQHPPHRPEAGI